MHLQNANFLLGHYPAVFKLPTGEPQREWIDTVPNDGVIYYRFIWNEPRVLVTNPKALAEVLVQRNYEFIKPPRIRSGLGRLLGIGILLAEGDEHKASYRSWVEDKSNNATEAAQSLDACLLFPPYQRSVFRLLGQITGNDGCNRKYYQD